MNDLEQEFFLAEFAAGKKHGGVDQRQMGVGLWEIPQEAFRLKIEVLTEQSQVVGMAQKLVEFLPGFFFLSNHVEGSDEPKGANGEGRRGFAKVVLVAVAEHKVFMTELFLYGFNGAYKRSEERRVGKECRSRR